jgi:hypothetical protein
MQKTEDKFHWLPRFPNPSSSLNSVVGQNQLHCTSTVQWDWVKYTPLRVWIELNFWELYWFHISDTRRLKGNYSDHLNFELNIEFRHWPIRILFCFELPGLCILCFEGLKSIECLLFFLIHISSLHLLSLKGSGAFHYLPNSKTFAVVVFLV